MRLSPRCRKNRIFTIGKEYGGEGKEDIASQLITA